MNIVRRKLQAIIDDCYIDYIYDIFPQDRRMNVIKDAGIIGMNTENMQFFINETVKKFCYQGTYMEVGVFQGSMLCSAALYNKHTRCIGIDNFSQFDKDGINHGILKSNINKLKLANVDFHNLDYKTAIKELFEREPNLKVDVYYYDGNHSAKDQYDGLDVMKDHLADDCVVLIDDINWRHVEKATDKWLLDNPDFRLFQKIRFSPILIDKKSNKEFNHSLGNWWNGFYVIYREGKK